MIDFPDWVGDATRCKGRTYTELQETPHGAVKLIYRVWARPVPTSSGRSTAECSTPSN